MRFHILVAAAAVLCGSAAARADDFTYTLTGTASSNGASFSGTGTFSGSEVPGLAGAYNITSISGSNTNGIVPFGGYNGNDNLLTPDASTFVDTSGIGFYDQTADGVYQVRLYKSTNGECNMQASTYCIDLEEINTAGDPGASTLPVSFPGSPGNPAHVAVRFSLARVAAPVSTAATPEPGSLALLGSGALALIGLGRRRFTRS